MAKSNEAASLIASNEVALQLSVGQVEAHEAPELDRIHPDNVMVTAIEVEIKVLLLLVVWVDLVERDEVVADTVRVVVDCS